MDISKLTHGAKLVLGGTILFLIVSIFHWHGDRSSASCRRCNMWHGWGVLAGLLAIAIIVWEGLRLANMKIEIGLTPAMVTAALAILLLVFTVLEVPGQQRVPHVLGVARPAARDPRSPSAPG